ncbi:MAG TPA: ATP-binding protein [Nitrospirae bacterium]|nr:ATP-binding protein [Nitrospirota bacterium]
MEDLSLHILDIAENSVSAGASVIQIKITEDIKENVLLVEISDNGEGMDENAVKAVTDPFFTTKAERGRRVGLGIPLLAQAAREADGDISIVSEKGRGTTIKARFQHDHIDRKPVGDIAMTLTILISANPEIDFVFEYKRNDQSYEVDTREIREELEDVPINDPAVIKFIKDSISKWLSDTKSIMLE